MPLHDASRRRARLIQKFHPSVSLTVDDYVDLGEVAGERAKPESLVAEGRCGIAVTLDTVLDTEVDLEDGTIAVEADDGE